jgi:hypothetical protein
MSPLLSAKQIAMPFPTNIVAQKSPITIIIAFAALEDTLNIGERSFMNSN